MLNVRVCGALEVEADEGVLPDVLFGGRQGRLVFAYLVCERHRAVRREELAELLWPEQQLPDSWSASLSAMVSRLRRLLSAAGIDGATAIGSSAGSYQLSLPRDATVDVEVLTAAVADAEAAVAAGDVERALAAAAIAETIAARGFLTDDSEWVDRQRESLRDLRVRAALAQSGAHLVAGSSARAVEAARAALELDPTREASYRQLMRSLAAAGERGEALRVWEHCRITLVEELGVDPAPETERVYLEIIGASSAAASAPSHLPSGVVTFLLTDIVESSAMWEAHTAAMATALERHDAIVGEVVDAHGGTLLKSKLEGDATVSVFARATECASAALALLDALASEPWPDATEPRVRVAMHTGEAFERNGDYFGPALNRAARLRSIARAGEVLMSQAVAELVRDHLPDGVVLRDRGHRDLRGLSRGENVYELARSASANERGAAPADPSEFTRPPVAPALAGAGPFVGRSDELAQLGRHWASAAAGESGAVFVGGEPGVGKSRLAGELAVRVHAAGGLVLYGRCDEDLGAPLQPFLEAARALVPALGAARLRAVRGIGELLPVVPALAEQLGDEERAARADPDTERLALFDAVSELFGVASCEAPLLLVLDDLHWAGKTTLSLLRHLLRGAKGARLLILGTYRDTELARTHPLAATLADVRRDVDVHRITLGGLEPADVDAYLEAVGNDDHALARELSELTSGNPFFLIEVLRHVDEAGGVWEPGTLPEGVREATGRRLSRLSDSANDALAVAAVVGATFDLALVEQVQHRDLIDEIVEASQAGLVIEEPGSPDRFRFAHALVRQVLLAELVTLKRVRLHRTIAELLEAMPTPADVDAHLADLAHHWFECASAGGARKAVDACSRAADRAMERLAYEEAADLYGMALEAFAALDDAEPELLAMLLLARCDALLTAGDVAAAREAIDALERSANGSERLAAWYTIYDGMLAVLAEPDRLVEIVQSIGAAADAMHALGDLTGEAKAHHVHASALERLGQIGAAERALDAALAAARATGNRRLADAILAEAPNAALWGPTPITRASGDCLDVIRVLRIADGAPAVEAVALRCQAVLEALRGRFDAARRMLASARRTVVQLGLTHRRLEIEVAAGTVELLDGKPVPAERYLRAAYDELRTLGLDGEAAEAAAALGRALLLQRRLDEAEAVAYEAEELAGSDLKAAVHWRDVRAFVALRRGDNATAHALAVESVELASATDALLLIADARLTLATVLHESGDFAAAQAEARRALEACDAKGMTVLLDRIRAGVETPVPRGDIDTGRRTGGGTSAEAPQWFENAAWHAATNLTDLARARSWTSYTAALSPDFEFHDNRRGLQIHLVGNAALESARVFFEIDEWTWDQALLATRDDRLALTRDRVVFVDGVAGPSEVLTLSVTECDADGRVVAGVIFDPDDLMRAHDELDRRHVALGGNPLGRTLRHAVAEQDWEMLATVFAPDCTFADYRTAGWGSISGPQFVDYQRAIADLAPDARIWIDHSRARGNVALSTGHVSGSHDGGTWEIAYVTVGVTGPDGRSRITENYDLEDMAIALARFDELATAANEPGGNAAWRAAVAQARAVNARSWEGFAATLAPDETMDDRRTAIATRLRAEEARDMYRMMFAFDRCRQERVLVATRGDHLALFRSTTTFEDGAAGPAEVVCLNILEVDERGQVARSVVFDTDDLDGATRELDARAAEVASPLDIPRNRAARAVEQPGWTLTAAVTDDMCLHATPEGLVLHEVDEFGVVTKVMHFTADERRAASEEIARHYAEHYGFGGGSALLNEAMNARDLGAVRECMSPSCVVADHRRLRVGDLRDRDSYLAMLVPVFELAVDYLIEFPRVYAVEPWGHVTLARNTGTTEDGGPFETSCVALTTWDDDGHITRIEIYEPEDVAKAVVRFRALAP